MRILMFTDYFFPNVGGGVEKVILEISIRLVKLGHEVCVLTLNTTDAKKEEYIHGIRIVRVKAFDLTKIIGLQSAFSLNLCGVHLQLLAFQWQKAYHENSCKIYLPNQI